MYEQFFNFKAKPFQLNPDPSFFYGSRGHKRAMAYLEYGLHQSEGFIVITGEIGAGKTTIVRNLLEQLDEDKVVAANLVSTQIDADNVLRMVAAAFGVPSRNLGKADLLLALETFLVSVAASGKRALLIVDEAQNLTPAAVEELRMLSNFQLEDHALLQSFLIGQPEFRDILQSPHMQQLRQRVIASYHLGPLDSQETRAYIEHRLRHVGWQDNPRIDVSAYAGIYAYTSGIPRRINTLCDRLLLAAYLNESRLISSASVRETVAELKSEFELRTRPASDAFDAPAAGTHLAGVAEAPLPAVPAIDPARLQLPPALLAQFSGVAGNIDTQRIEARLTALEQSVTATLQVLQQILQAVQQEATTTEENKDE